VNPFNNRPAVTRGRRAGLAAGGLALTLLAAAGPVAAAPAATAAIVGGTLQVTGSPLAEHLALRLDGADPTKLDVDFGDDAKAEFTFPLADFRAIDVEAGNGNDTVRIDQVNGIFTTTKPTRIDGQNGDDTLLGGNGDETFVGGRGDDFADGNGGADTAFLGKGDDVFVWDPGDGSDTVEGQAGLDTMVFNGASGNEIMAATAVGERVHFTRNLGTIVMDLDDVEAVDVRALGGTDSITVNDVSGTDLRRVDVDLAGALGGTSDDGAADTVKVVGTPGADTIAATADGAAVDVSGLAAFVRITHSDPADDSLVIDGGGGGDAVVLDPALAALIAASVV
jgi:Ca2+-binding RTX toxin-like protein